MERNKVEQNGKSKGKILESMDGHPLGLKGLLNLGCTCYINSVTQVLLHAPGFRDYFLGGGHDNRVCPHSNCFICELDLIFQAAYSGNRVPLAPADLLHAIWNLEPEFADGGMHDAHDFWLLALEALRKSKGGSQLVDCVFGGKIQTTTVCSICKHTSSTVDHVLDLSLSLHRRQQEKTVTTPPRGNNMTESSSCHATTAENSKSENNTSRDDRQPATTSDSPDQSSSHTPASSEVGASSRVQSPIFKRRQNILPRCGECETCRNPKRKKGCLRNKKLRLVSQESSLLRDCTSSRHSRPRPSSPHDFEYFDEKTSLQKCLTDFLQPETLRDWMCEKCSRKQQAEKVTRMEEVPWLLGVHLKRFAFNMGTGVCRKLEMHVECPHVLDITYLGATCCKDTAKKPVYRLCSIVAHGGTLNGGHYWCYMKKSDVWYKINDGLIVTVEESEVDACEAYMAFYVKDRRGCVD